MGAPVFLGGGYELVHGYVGHHASCKTEQYGQHAWYEGEECHGSHRAQGLRGGRYRGYEDGLPPAAAACAERGTERYACRYVGQCYCYREHNPEGGHGSISRPHYHAFRYVMDGYTQRHHSSRHEQAGFALAFYSMLLEEELMRDEHVHSQNEKRACHEGYDRKIIIPELYGLPEQVPDPYYDHYPGGQAEAEAEHPLAHAFHAYDYQASHSCGKPGKDAQEDGCEHGYYLEGPV